MTGHEAGNPSPYVLGLPGFSIAGLVLLASPAIRSRTPLARRPVDNAGITRTTWENEDN